MGRCDFEYVKSRIEHGPREFEGRFTVVPLPNISHIFYGRDVGYSLERINLNELTKSVEDPKEAFSRPVKAFLKNHTFAGILTQTVRVGDAICSR